MFVCVYHTLAKSSESSSSAQEIKTSTRNLPLFTTVSWTMDTSQLISYPFSSRVSTMPTTNFLSSKPNERKQRRLGWVMQMRKYSSISLFTHRTHPQVLSSVFGDTPNEVALHLGSLNSNKYSCYEDTLQGHLAEYLIYLSTAQSFWFSLNSSYDNDFHLSQQFGMTAHNYECLLVAANLAVFHQSWGFTIKILQWKKFLDP